MSFENIILDKANGVAKIILNRPQVLNAMNEELMQEMAEAIEDTGQDDSIGVLVITGAGRAFSAGRDMKEIRQRPEGVYRPAPPTRPMLENLDKPVIAAVNGYCFTGALELVLSFDIIVASENAVFGDTHARYGLVHGGGATQRLPRLVGAMKAKELLFLCEPISATEAERIGLANKVVAADKLEEAVMEMAAKILSNSRTSLGIIKGLVNRGMKMDLAAGLELEAVEYQRYRERSSAADTNSRLGNFLEKKIK